jgi:3'(2'), 5'-bisphosphate nucleotidase
MNLEHELKVAKSIAIKGGKLALSLRNNLAITQKANGEGPVTNADIAVDQLLVSELAKEFPDDQIISEESFLSNVQIEGARTWFVDPIDGTSRYIVGGDDFSVMIGLSINGIPRLGVIYQPAPDILWWGIFSEDPITRHAEKIDHTGSKSIVLDLPNEPPLELTMLASRSHPSQKQEMMIKELNPKNVRMNGSLGLKAMLILGDDADIYVAWSKAIKKWDTCAATAILKAAGANMTFIDNEELSFLGPIAHEKPIMMLSFIPDKKLLETLNGINNGTIKQQRLFKPTEEPL